MIGGLKNMRLNVGKIFPPVRLNRRINNVMSVGEESQEHWLKYSIERC